MPAEPPCQVPAPRKTRPIHLIFKPAEEIRILRGARNIGVIYWEFDKLVGAVPFENVTHNQVRMLGLLDGIWVANSYLNAVLQRYGIENVHVVPCPVPAFPTADLTQDNIQDRFGDLSHRPCAMSALCGPPRFGSRPCAPSSFFGWFGRCTPVFERFEPPRSPQGHRELVAWFHGNARTGRQGTNSSRQDDPR